MMMRQCAFSQWGIGDHVQVSAAEEYLFTIYITAVGVLYKGGLSSHHYIVDHEHDRVAADGTGTPNYASTLATAKKVKETEYDDVLYLDPATHTKVDEFSSANFFANEKYTHKFVTPKSDTVLPFITKKSLLCLAENCLGLEVEEGNVRLDELVKYTEAGAMGNALLFLQQDLLLIKIIDLFPTLKRRLVQYFKNYIMSLQVCSLLN